MLHLGNLAILSKYVGPFLRLPLSSIFCFIVALGPSTLSTIAKFRSAVARDVDYLVLIPSRTNAWRVRSRL